MSAISQLDGEQKVSAVPAVPANPARAGSGSAAQVVVLRMRSSEYALPIGRVQEIVRVPEITPLPEAPPGVEGLINLRGRVLPVVDLASRLGLGKVEQTRNARVVIVKSSGEQVHEVGLLVDSVSKVLRLGVDDVEPTSEIAAGDSRSLILGVAKVNDQLILLLDLDGALNNQQIAETFTG
ncbi:MAG: chemotaxis protein CheW [Chloroflexota bacterium]|nr:chemotaxis protein CheW [Chloroflexota bacterium]